MGLFTRRTKYRLTGPDGPAVPGREATVTLAATRVRPGTTLGTVHADVTCSGRKSAPVVQTDGLDSGSVAAQLRVVRHEIAVDRALAEPEDSVALGVWVPWATPVTRIGDQRTGASARIEVGPGYGEVSVDVPGLPFHDALLAVATELGWSYKRCEVWDVGGKKRPVEQTLWFSPGDEFAIKGFKLAHVEVVPVATSADSGELRVTVVARKLGPGLFPLGRLDAVPLSADAPEACVTALREGIARVVGGAGSPAGIELDGQVLEALLRVLLRG